MHRSCRPNVAGGNPVIDIRFDQQLRLLRDSPKDNLANCGSIEMTDHHNPYASPANHDPHDEDSTSRWSIRAILFLQATAVAFCVVVGTSEINAQFSWARPLILVAPFVALFQSTSPFAIYARRGNKFLTFAAFAVSCALAIVGLWAMFPLMQ